MILHFSIDYEEHEQEEMQKYFDAIDNQIIVDSLQNGNFYKSVENELERRVEKLYQSGLSTEISTETFLDILTEKIKLLLYR